MIKSKDNIFKKLSEKGQVVVLMLLVMVIALAVGLSAISRSITEVSTSRKSEDSSRAFSAAEAGIEKAIRLNQNFIGGTPVPVAPFSMNNQAGSSVIIGQLPVAGTALEYPPFGKESFAQFWLANPNTSPLTSSYTADSFYIYFGTPDTSKYTSPNGNRDDQPAVEVNVISWDGIKYNSNKYYFTSTVFNSNTDSTRQNFVGCDGTSHDQTVQTNNHSASELSHFYCKATVTGYPYTLPSYPVMVRVRILYSNISHPVALAPKSGSSFPLQANIYQAVGSSGVSKRSLEVFHQKSVMPQIFDYVLFSAGNLQK